VNVSGWKDEDKEGGTYRQYFSQAKSYTITNYKSEARGFQGMQNEIFLDLTQDLPSNLLSKFDVVFNHTTLEHIFEVEKAFQNLCDMSRDVVIIVVPFLQQMHADYGDYWRFTPLAVKKLFEKYSFEVLHLSFNTDANASVYVFAVASRHPERWNGILHGEIKIGLDSDLRNGVIGYNAFPEVQTKKKVTLFRRALRRMGLLKM